MLVQNYTVDFVTEVPLVHVFVKCVESLRIWQLHDRDLNRRPVDRKSDVSG